MQFRILINATRSQVQSVYARKGEIECDIVVFTIKAGDGGFAVAADRDIIPVVLEQGACAAFSTVFSTEPDVLISDTQPDIAGFAPVFMATKGEVTIAPLTGIPKAYLNGFGILNTGKAIQRYSSTILK
jgi:hypothetical protein